MMDFLSRWPFARTTLYYWALFLTTDPYRPNSDIHWCRQDFWLSLNWGWHLMHQDKEKWLRF